MPLVRLADNQQIYTPPGRKPFYATSGRSLLSKQGVKYYGQRDVATYKTETQLIRIAWVLLEGFDSPPYAYFINQKRGTA